MSYLPDYKIIARWKLDPILFVTEALRAEPDDWQLDVLRQFNKHNRIALVACKGPGKSTVLAWLIILFLVTRPYAKIIVTSISADNLADGLWAELSKWMRNNAWIMARFTINKTSIVCNEHPEEWFVAARAWSKSADTSQQANTLAGKHADYMMFVLDESGGIPDAVAVTAEAALATGKETKILQAGNPTHLEGPLYRACTNEKHLWYVKHVTADPDDPQRSPRVDKKWAIEQIEKYGKDNPWVIVNVFGEFPPSSINTLLGPDEVRKAMERRYDEDEYKFSQKRLGIDVARFGSDATVIFPRQGLQAFMPVVMRNARTTDIAARVMMSKSSFGSEIDFIDDTGHWGHGVIDNLIAAGYSPVGVMFHGAPNDPRFKNKRAEMWCNMAEWVKRGGALPHIPELVVDLTAPQYSFVNGKFQLEDKDQIKARTGRSPDYGDALALSFSYPEMPANVMEVEGVRIQMPGIGAMKAKRDYKPFSRRAN